MKEFKGFKKRNDGIPKSLSTILTLPNDCYTQEQLIAKAEKELPNFCEAVAQAEASGGVVTMHHDSFGADLQLDEAILQGMACKYAALHGVSLHFEGTHRETLGE